MSKLRFNSDDKNIIRQQWAIKILRFLKKETQSELVYMGLPSPDALDIEQWIKYINKVIAFQCRDYPNRSDSTQSRDEIVKLETKLRKWKREGQLDDFIVYDGYIEEVLSRGTDNIGNEFNQSEVVRVYNFDFCNNIVDPIEYIDKDGVRKCNKFNAIKKALDLQNELSGIKKFVLFLTVKASYSPIHLDHFLESSSQDIRNKPKEERLRYVVVKNLLDIIKWSNFVPHFLPTFLYQGDGENKLLHFTIMGTQDSKPVTERQNIDNYVSQCKFITELNNDERIQNIVRSFKNSNTYKHVWANN